MEKRCSKPKPLIRSFGQPLVVFSLFLMFLIVVSCKDDGGNDEFNPALPVVVNEIIPDSGTITMPLVINGSNFGTDKSKIKVMFGDREALIISAKNEHLYVLNPKQEDGEHTLKVVVDGKEGVLANKFRYIVTSSVTTVAGTGEYDDVDGPALEACLVDPAYLSIDDKNNILFTDYFNYKVKLLSLEDSKVTTLIKATDIYGGCFSNDFSHYYATIESGSKTRIAYDFYRPGNWAQGFLINTNSIFNDYPCAITVDKNDDLFVIGYNGGIAKINGGTHEIHVLGRLPEYINTGIDYYMVYNPFDEHLYISSPNQHVIIRLDARKTVFGDDDFEIFAGALNQSGFNNGPRENATFKNPKGMDFDSEGNMYVADYNNNAIRKITLEGIVTTLAGGTAGHKDGVVEEAMFDGPADVTLSPEDFIYVAETRNRRIRCIAVQ